MIRPSEMQSSLKKRTFETAAIIAIKAEARLFGICFAFVSYEKWHRDPLASRHPNQIKFTSTRRMFMAGQDSKRQSKSSPSRR